MATIQQNLDFNNDLSTRLSNFKPPSSFVHRFKDYDKTTKRDIIGAETTEKQRQKNETAETEKKYKKRRLLRRKLIKKDSPSRKQLRR